LMLRSLKFWLYDRDPLAVLAFEAPLAAIKAKIANGERYFEALIRRYLLVNNHRTTLLLRPDPKQAPHANAERRTRLAAVPAQLTEEELRAIFEETRALKRFQETPDAPEALATIPTLKLADLPRQNRLIPIETSSTCATRLVYHELCTNGVVYLDLGFDL